ncbi:MAG: Crp/Fnr family transcriptional regulator [Acidimicrobiia bacterium]
MPSASLQLKGAATRTGAGNPGGSLLSPAEWRDLDRRGTPRRYRTRQVLFREGDAGGTVLAIRSGRVKVSLHTPAGRELVLAVKEPGELLGELSALDGRRRSATAQALERVDALVVDTEQFTDFVASQPRVALRLLRAVATQLRDTDRDSIERYSGDVTSRVARRLVELAERFGEDASSGLEIALPLSHSDLAAWVGASRESTSRALGRLRAGHCVSTGHRRITISDLARLRASSV